MVMRIKFLTIFICTNWFLCTYAQNVQQNIDKNFFVGFSTGQASDNIYTKSLPATFIATYPSNDSIPNSYAINGFFGVDFKLGDKSKPKWKFSINTEYHRNTLISKEQNTTLIGISINHFIPLLYTDKTKLYPRLILKPEFSFKHSEDRIKEKKGLQFLGYLSLSLPLAYEKSDEEESLLNFIRPNIIYPGDIRGNIDSEEKYGTYLSDWIQLKHFHSIGIENIGYESLLILNASFGIELYPFSGILYEFFKRYSVLQLKYYIVDRQKISSGKTELFTGTSETFGINLNYKLDEDGKTAFSFGYEYNSGGNPLKGLESTTFEQLKLSLILSL